MSGVLSSQRGCFWATPPEVTRRRRVTSAAVELVRGWIGTGVIGAIHSCPEGRAQESRGRRGIAGRGVLYFSRLISRAAQSHLSRVVSMPIYQNMTIRDWRTTTTLLWMMGQASATGPPTLAHLFTPTGDECRRAEQSQWTGLRTPTHRGSGARREGAQLCRTTRSRFGP